MAGTIRGAPAAFSRPWRGCLSASSVAPGCYLSAPCCAPPPPPSLHAAINAGRGLGYFRRNVPGLPLPGLRRGGPAVISFVCGGLSGSREVAADRACQLDLKPVRSLKSLCFYER